MTSAPRPPLRELPAPGEETQVCGGGADEIGVELAPKRWTLLRVAGVVLAGVAMQILVQLLSYRVGYVVSSAAVLLVAYLGVVGFVRLARAGRGRIRSGWVVGAISAGLLTAAYAIYTAQGLLDRDFFGLGEMASLASACVAMPGLVLIAPPLRDMVGRLTVALDIAAVAGALFAMAWKFILLDAGRSLDLASQLWLNLFVIVDVACAALAMVLMSRSTPTPDGYALRLLSGGFVIFAGTAAISAHNQVEHLPWYATGASAGYLIAALLITLASRTTLPPADDTRQRALTGFWALMPYGAVLIAVAEVIRSYVTSGDLPAILMWFLLGAVTVVMLRQFLMLFTIRGLLGTLRYQAHHDILTGLPNRAAFYQRAEAELATADEDRLTAVLVLDLDGFKQVNDMLGHAAGDALLVTVGHRMSAALRHTDLAARLGGDEFVVLLPAIEEAEQANDVASRLLHGIAEPMTVAGEVLRVRASIGIALRRGAGHGLDPLLQDADTALYDAKAAGKGTFRRHYATSTAV